MRFADYQASEPLTHSLAMSYRFVTETEFPPDTVGIMERAAIHIEAAYHLLTVAEFIQRTAPVEPENVVAFPGAEA
jgi:hypothetical protein